MPNDNWTPNRDRVELLAYQYWMERGCLHGCHEDDWYRAEQEIRRQRGEAPPAVPDRTVVGVFRSIDDARNVYDKLVAEGFTRGEVSVVANRTGTADLVRNRADVPDPATPDVGAEVATDAGIGASSSETMRASAVMARGGSVAVAEVRLISFTTPAGRVYCARKTSGSA